MTTERRYDDEEVRAIFRLATETGRGEASSPGPGAMDRGLTVAELEAIGAEAGIDRALIVRAAAQLERQLPEDSPQRMLGVPVSVAHSVDLPTPLNDTQWDRLVVLLRDTFQARGKVHREGSLRSWSNGNLQILLEPTAGGQRLRMRSLSSQVKGMLGAGVGVAAMALAGGALLLALGGLTTGAALGLAGVVAFGGVYAGAGVVRGPRWVSLRSGQFVEIGRVAQEMAERGGSGPPSLPGASGGPEA